MTLEKFSSDFLDTDQKTPRASAVFRIYKRSLDMLVSLALIPGFALCAVILFVLNPLINRGTILYTQERVGRRGERFHIYKFRTMAGSSCEENPRFAPDEEARINPLGAFMRRTRIDELPQILNVLKGDMSIVGPRPEQVMFYREYEQGIPGYARRQTVRPGITGLAQLKYGYTSDEAGTARKLKWDLEYINRMGFRLELYIMGLTFLFVMGRLLRLRMTKAKL